MSRFSSSPPAAGRVLEPSWSGSSNYSRFSISPASIASFSLTHLTDSDIEQGGKWHQTCSGIYTGLKEQSHIVGGCQEFDKKMDTTPICVELI